MYKSLDPKETLSFVVPSRSRDSAMVITDLLKACSQTYAAIVTLFCVKENNPMSFGHDTTVPVLTGSSNIHKRLKLQLSAKG